MDFFVFITMLMIASMTKTAYSCRTERSCQEIYQQSINPVPGEYQLCTPTNRTFDVFCDFYDGYGYTYISKRGLGVLQSLSQLYNDRSHVVVRHRQINGIQKDVEISPLSAFRFRYPMSIQLSQAIGYNVPVNAALRPYIYLGFLPAVYARSRTTQGYQVAGVDITFTNCDSNPNSYLAFFANPSNLPLNDYYTRCCMSSVVNAWITRATDSPLSRYLPQKYFYDFEMHMGGCGGYVSTGSFPSISGATVGFRFTASL
ncbi:hypothetical protein ACJMK2_042200 [Sinanodonta woodiana]|uniref:Wall-associated receptor kinase galacturonan-binding domain-containing protein n=1 Tax=Sinanodonta woodiana TaxID=1069815 RepID=A0ABD3W6M9_SINWO